MNFLWAFNISRAKDPSGRENDYDLHDFTGVSPGPPPSPSNTPRSLCSLPIRCGTIELVDRAKPLRERDNASLRWTCGNDQT